MAKLLQDNFTAALEKIGKLLPPSTGPDASNTAVVLRENWPTVAALLACGMLGSPASAGLMAGSVVAFGAEKTSSMCANMLVFLAVAVLFGPAFALALLLVVVQLARDEPLWVSAREKCSYWIESFRAVVHRPATTLPKTE